ncbi:MAG: hypothetical protein QOG41_983, partial [Thermoleophilaceae bacterium]|nr:hypothetical protein [Thermoleophilaceae bacterium]
MRAVRRRGALAACAAALGLVVAAPTAARAATGDYLVGAAKVDITPPAFDAAHDEPAFAICTPVYTGLRRFRFEEPYIDSNSNGRYDFGVTNQSPPEPYCDANQNGRYDGIFLSGAIDSMATAVHDPIDARAIAISAKGHTYVVASVVAQGLFENYIEEMRQEAEKRRPIAGMVVSANHNESSPDTIGIYGSPEVGGVAGGRSGIDEYYMDWLVGRVADAATAAYDSMEPGTLFARQVPIPDGVRVRLSNNFPTTYDDENKPAAIDPKVGLLQARAGGKAVFTVMSLAAHNQEIGHSGLSSAPDPAHPDVKVPLNQQISSDWPGYFHRKLEAGGDAGMPMFLVGDNGSEEDAETVPPVGTQFPECLEPGSTTNTDGCYPQAQATGEALAAAVAGEVKKADRLPFGSMNFDRRALYVPVENNAFKAAFAAGLFGERPGYTGSTKTGPAGKDLRTFVSVLDVGPQLQLISNPGEAFPALMIGSPFGIDEVACPNRPNPRVPTWRAHAAYRFQVGLADDMIGYEIPAWSFIEPGVFTTDQCDAQGGDPKGHRHKLESEGVGPTASNAVAEGSSSLVASHGVDPAAVIRPGRFVLPDGTLTRRPNGAVGVWVADSADAKSLTPGKGVVVGLKRITGFGTTAVGSSGRMMDYDGVDQAGEGDVLTRGMVVFGCSGAPSKRYYLDVYPALSGPSKLGGVTHGTVGAGCGSGQPGVGTPGNPHTGPPLVGGED